MADDDLLQKDEIGAIRPAPKEILRKREARMALLPDCARSIKARK